MKTLLSALSFLTLLTVNAQNSDTLSECYISHRRPMSLSFSYFGEMITHPGAKIGFNYQLKTRNKLKKRKSEKTGINVYSRKYALINASVGFLHHKNYQTGYFGLIELRFRTENQNDRFFELGIGFGFLRTATPSVSVENGVLETQTFGNNYGLASVSLGCGKSINILEKVPLEIMIRPQFLYAFPNFPNGVTYMALEAGINYKFTK